MRRASAFTLVETLLVLALIGLLATVTVTGLSAFAQAGNESDAETLAHDAVAQSRRAAVTSGREISLRVTEDRTLQWDGGQIVLPGDGARVRLLPAEREAAVLIGGQLSEEPLPAVKFYPDGTCDAFRLELVRGAARKVEAFDRWTCAPLEKSDD